MNTEILTTKKVGDLVRENIKTAHVFKKHGIDFCCGGGISLEKACEKYQVDPKVLLSDLDHVDKPSPQEPDYSRMEPDALCDHIIQKHHTYVASSIPMILSYAKKVAEVHGAGHPPVIEINNLFTKVADELESHMKKEETILFPYIKSMALAAKTGARVVAPHFGTVRNPVSMMELEHEHAGELLKEINRLSNGYNPPDWACNTFKALYAKLDEFEQDLHLHVHLENNILFPAAVEMEKKLTSH